MESKKRHKGEVSEQIKRKEEINDLIQCRRKILAKVRQSLQQLVEVCTVVNAPTENVLKFKEKMSDTFGGISAPEPMEEDGM